MAPSDPRQTKFVLDEIAHPAGLVQHRRRPAGAAVAVPPPGHAPADRPGRPRAALPDGAHRPGGLGRARDRDPGAGPRRLPALPAEPALPRPPARAGARYAGPHLLQVRGRQPGRQPQAEHRARRRPSTTRRRASSASRPRPAPASGAARWRSPARSSGSRSRSTWSAPSYDQKPYRRILMETYGAEVVASPSLTTNYGRSVLGETPDSPGSLGIAISEAVEDAATRDDTKYALGSVLNHVLLHQTVIGQEAIEQMGDGRRVARRHHRLRRRRLELRRADVPVPRPQLPRGREAPDHRRRARGGPEPDPRRLRLRLRRHRAR